MRMARSRGAERTSANRARFAMMIFGIILFVVGFLLTLASVPQASSSGTSASANDLDGGSSSSGSASHLFLVAGICVSFAGVVLATVIPAVRLIRADVGK
jgi:Na+/proline symporter